MRAIKYDCQKKTIEEIQLENTLESFYKAIGNGCDTMENAFEFDYNGKSHTVIVDENGRISRNPIGGVILKGIMPLVGNVIVVGFDEDSGNAVSATIAMADAELFLDRFLSREESALLQLKA